MPKNCSECEKLFFENDIFQFRFLRTKLPYFEIPKFNRKLFVSRAWSKSLKINISTDLSKPTTDLIIQESQKWKAGFQYLEISMQTNIILRHMLSKSFKIFIPANCMPHTSSKKNLAIIIPFFLDRWTSNYLYQQYETDRALRCGLYLSAYPGWQ